jgi:K+-dependent Na+/Ca+ exchanger-like protein
MPKLYWDRESVRRKRLKMRAKNESRAIFRTLAMVTLVVVFCAYNLVGSFGNQVDYSSRPFGSRFLAADVNATEECPEPEPEYDPETNEVIESCKAASCVVTEDSPAMVVLYVLGVLYMFVALAIVCDEFFVPALEEMSNEDHMNLSMDVAGATLMAAGGSAPELFTSLLGTFRESDVGFGTIVGSAVFNVLFVIGMCAMFSKEVLTLTWWPLFRDVTYYLFGLIVLFTFFAIWTPGEIHLVEALILFCMYFGYVVLMAYNQDLYRWLMKARGVASSEEDEDHNIAFVRPSTFRAGLLKLLMKDGSFVDTAGVGIVSKISGNVEEVFKQVDKSGNGLIDSDELKNLFVLLECPVTDAELAQSMKDLDLNGDGQIDFAEFTKWYIMSEARIRNQTHEAFNKFDVNNSGTIEKGELNHLLVSLGDKPSDDQITEAIKEMYQSGNPDEITFEEFSAWYEKSLFWTEHKKEAEEAGDVAEGVWSPFPSDGTIGDKLKWLLLVPLVGSQCLTIPDVRQPGRQKWCYVAFIMSIVWIGVYSVFMVAWVDVVGNTLGIPIVVMGVTFLAAGTSVPDLLSSVIVAKMGEGDMAVSSSIGSNIFDILVGLPLPWLIYMTYLSSSDVAFVKDDFGCEVLDAAGEKIRRTFVVVGAEGIATDILILVMMLFSIVLIIHFSGWKMTKALGGAMFVLYFIFVGQSVGRQLPFPVMEECCPNVVKYI